MVFNIKVGSIIKLTEEYLTYLNDSSLMALNNCCGIINKYYVVKDIKKLESPNGQIKKVPIINLLVKSNNPDINKKVIKSIRLFEEKNYKLIKKNELSEYLIECFKTKGILCMNIDEAIICWKIRNQVIFKDNTPNIASMISLHESKNSLRVKQGLLRSDINLIDSGNTMLISEEKVSEFVEDNQITLMCNLKETLEIFAKQYNL